MSDTKHGGENVKAIRNCLEYLAKEARLIGLEELAQLIDVAVSAAEEVSGATYCRLPGGTRMVPPGRIASSSSAAPRNRLRRR